VRERKEKETDRKFKKKGRKRERQRNGETEIEKGRGRRNAGEGDKVRGKLHTSLTSRSGKGGCMNRDRDKTWTDRTRFKPIFKIERTLDKKKLHPLLFCF